MVTLLTHIVLIANLQEYHLNYIFLGIVSLGGILPIIYTLAFLQIAGKRSWYLFTLSVLTISLSVATLYRASYFHPNIEGLLSTEHFISGCGIRDPSMFCSVPGSRPFSVEDMSIVGAGTTLLISLLILGVLFLDQVRVHRLSAIQRYLTQHLRSISQPGSVRSSNTSKTHRILFYMSTWSLYLGLWLLYIYLFVLYFMFLSMVQNVGFWNTTKWTFGQIVAITVWVPALFEYGYLEARKSRLCELITFSWLENTLCLLQKLTLRNRWYEKRIRISLRGLLQAWEN